MWGKTWVVLVAAAFALPQTPQDPPALVTNQALVGLQAEPLLDGSVLVCHGSEDCNGHGVCDVNNLCRCAPGWGGIDCSIEFECPNGCSNNGICQAHTCFCYHGYTGRDCSIELFCPNNCNGNGRCDRGQCICEAGFDGADCSEEVGCAYECGHGKCVNQICVCDEGYYGPACNDIDYCITNCTNHGKCKDKRCICDYGYTGVVCSTLIPCPHNCSKHGECVKGACLCDLGYTGIDCAEDCCPDQNTQCSAGKMCEYPPCHCHNDCSGNGICHRGRCICRHRFFGDDCSMRYCINNCSMHGTCDHAVGDCTCEEGWKGESCSEVECPNDCHGRGECMLFGGKSRICLCEEGFTGVDCGEEVPCPEDCSGHGLCHLGTCLCTNGWDGLDCSDEVEPWVPCENDCYDHGTCKDGVCVQCDEGWHGKFCNEQKVVETKPDGTIKCPGEPECSSHGLCGPGGKCFCAEEYLGEDCGTKKCPEDCSGRGSCKGGVCMCEHPYHSGPLGACEFTHCLNNCSGPSHGNCKKESGKCSCVPPWQGDDCSIHPCPGTPNECSNNGECDHTTGLCTCLADYAGEDCSLFMRCPDDCSGNGVCYRGVCYCYSNYTGASCKAIKRPPPPPGFDWEAPLREAQQQLLATARSVSPPSAPLPTSISIDDKKDLFKEVYGDDWLHKWNLVHSTPQKLQAFVKAVTSSPPPNDSSANMLRDKQQQLFKQVFGEAEWQDAWDTIMGSNQAIQDRFRDFFRSTEAEEFGFEARGPGLPPPPPIARDPTPQNGAAQVQQRLFTDAFGEGKGLATEMLIMGDRAKRDAFVHAFSDFLKANMNRQVEDKRRSWEDDMLQLMTDAMGAEGPVLLREILNDPKRAHAFREAFAGYLEQSPAGVNNLVELGEGVGEDTKLKSDAASAQRRIPVPV